MEKSVDDAGISLGFLAYLLIFSFFIGIGVLSKPISGFDRLATVAYGIIIGIPLLALYVALRRKSLRAK